MVQHHFLLVCCPAQGHMNPTLQLAKRLVRTGAHVTFATSVQGHRRMINSIPPPSLDGLSYASYSDGYDDGENQTDNPDLVMDRIKRIGSQSLSDLILSLANLRPVTCLIYAVLLPWVAEVAREHRVPFALLWIQPASVFTIFHNYFHVGHDLLNKDPSISVKLPGLPLLSHQDLPSFFHVSSPHRFALSTFKDHFLRLQEEPDPIVLVNSFDQIEGDAIRAVNMKNLDVFAIGPLIPSSEGVEEDEKSYGCDLFHDSVDRVDYIEWLNSKPESSVVYVAFGSMVELPSKQKEEIMRGMVESGRPFLWAGRPQLSLEEFEITSQEREGERLDSRGGDGGSVNGLLVEWCSQVEVLSHGAVGCFVSHCGWNSTLESMAGGVPMVGCPRWSDQTTVAKLVEDVWKFGVKAKEEEEGIVKSEEIKRCLEEVMGEGERGKEMRSNAWRLKDLVKEVMKKEDGCCWKNVEAFVEKLGNCSKDDEQIKK